MKIKDYIVDRNKYKVDSKYQRPVGAWSVQDNQCLIDTILKSEPMPLFFLNKMSDEDCFYVVDGQQRLNAIQLFYDNKIKLNKKFSGVENDGKTFNGENALTDDQKQKFLGYKLEFKILDAYDDEKVRVIFSRLQRGKPLTMGERLNAVPGEIVFRMRELAKHPFVSKSIGVSDDRYGVYPDIARIMFYEKFGEKDSGTDAIISFFESERDMDKNDKEFKMIKSVLNFLAKCFPPDPGDYKYLSKHAWILTVYSVSRELIQGYALDDIEQKFSNFVVAFHNNVYNEDFRSSNHDYQRFYDNVRGGWSERLIALRRDILLKKFLEKYKIKEKDEKRQITDEQKIECFSKNSKCEICRKNFKDYKAAEYHHKSLHSQGGRTVLSNIMVICSKCHQDLHGSSKIKLTQNDEEIVVE